MNYSIHVHGGSTLTAMIKGSGPSVAAGVLAGVATITGITVSPTTSSRTLTGGTPSVSSGSSSRSPSGVPISTTVGTPTVSISGSPTVFASTAHIAATGGVPSVTTGGTVVFSDNFNRADGAVGSSWANVDGAVIASHEFASATAWLRAFGRWNFPMPDPDYAVSMTLAGSAYGFLMIVRDDIVSSSVTAGFNSGTNKITISSTVNGTTTVRATSTGTYFPIGLSGDVLTFSAIGNVYTLYKNGTVIPGCTWTDSSSSFSGLNASVGVLTSTANVGISYFSLTDYGSGSGTTSITLSPPMGMGTFSWNEIEHLYTEVATMGPSYHRVGTNGGMTDATFAACLSAGLSVMVSVYPNTSSGVDPTSTQVNALLDAQLNRYGPGGTYWTANPSAPNLPVMAVEILNEPNWYLNGTVAQKAATYAPILINAYSHVKTNWPTVQVVGPSVSDASAGASAWIPTLFNVDSRVATSFDIFSFHPYTGCDSPLKYYAPDQTLPNSWGNWQVWAQLASLKSVMQTYGTSSSIPVWITEIGFPITGSDQGGTGLSNTTGQASVTLAQEAAYNIRTDIFCARQGITRCFHMYIDDDDGFNGGYFLYSSGAARPVATATQFMLSLVKNATSMDVVAETYGTGNPFVYRFHNSSGNPVIVAWAQTSQTSTIALSGQTQVYDQVGTSIATISGSSYSASLSETPIWIV